MDSEVQRYGFPTGCCLPHDIYTGWEGAFRRIAITCEKRLDPARWHRQLLYRMTLDVPSVRPAVIDGRPREELETLRTFRHLFRHNCAVQLRRERLEVVLRAYEAARTGLVRSLQQFTAQIEKVAREAEET